MKITPARKLCGIVRMPGDKSMSHRAALMAALADGRSRIRNFAASADCLATLECTRALGAGVNRAGSEVTISGKGKQGLRPAEDVLDCGNSGTTARLLAGLLSGQPFDSVLDGDSSLRIRPMNRIIAPLSMMGAAFETEDGTLPLTVRGRSLLRPVDYRLPFASAQVKSAVILAGLNAQGVTTVSSPPSDRPGPSSRDHTERMLRAFGVKLDETCVEEQGGFVHKVTVHGDSHISPFEFEIPGDISSAAFFLAAAACLEGSELTIEGVGLNPARTEFIDVLKELGARIVVERAEPDGPEPAGSVTVRGGFDPGTSISRLSGSRIANLIDELPVLAVLATRLPNGLEVREARELRFKESDRIASVISNLRKMGADADEFEDGFRIGPSALRGAVLDSFGDHRIAMAFSVAGLLAEGESAVQRAECVAVSFPGFFNVLEDVVN